MCCRLGCLSVLWTLLSATAAVASTAGFFSSDWIQGMLYDPMEMRNVTAHMSSFRRCNYPQLNGDGQSFIVHACGRYSADIPTVWWQVTTVLSGLGWLLSVYVAVRAVLSLCLTQVLSTPALTTLGRWQFVAACCIGAGVALFPLGWDHLEVLELCGYKSCPFTLGSCQLGISTYLLCVSVPCLVLSSCLSFCSDNDKEPP